MEINLFNNYDKHIEFDIDEIITNISNYFNLNKTISLILVNAYEIRQINKDYRKIDAVTDVISFEDDSGDEEYLGDIFICIDKVYEQAKSYDHSYEREFAFLLVHGLLHLQGYDHNTKEEETEMFKKQDEILKKLNYRRSNNE